MGCLIFGLATSIDKGRGAAAAGLDFAATPLMHKF